MEVFVKQSIEACKEKITLGNQCLVSQEEERIAAFLREKNLARVNADARSIHPIDSFYSRTGKRILDITIALVALVVTLPLNMLFAVCTYFDVGKPILFRQSRVGKNGRVFTMIKFRNMTKKEDHNGKMLPASQRVTKFGHFMRKYSLDELLNFWSVLKGDMSIIGPRPFPVFFEERMSEHHKKRHKVRPGLECPRVLAGEENGEYWYHLQFENDIWYVENISLLTDIKMLILLWKMAFNSTQRGEHADAGTYFVGYNDNGIAISLRQAKEQYPEQFKLGI